MDPILAGIGYAADPATIAFVGFGVLLGYLVGVLPGLNRATAIAVTVPLTFYMTPISAIGFLIGVSKGSATGGSVTAILLNTPGEPSSAVTCIDGHPLARQGRAKTALMTALYGSVIGDLMANLVLIAIAAPLAPLALKIGPFEICALLIFSLTFIASLSGRSLMKGLIAGALGIFFGTVGLDPETSTTRLTFGIIELQDGIPLLAVGIGMLALSEMMIQMERRHADLAEAVAIGSDARDSLSFRELRSLLPTFLRSGAIGTAVGMVPGLGATVASFLAYGAAKAMSATPDRFGKGAVEGVAAAETADNAVVPASLVPLFTLGIPGNVSAALLVGAFLIHGVTPGPLMFEKHASLVYGIFATMMIASVLMLVIGRVGLRLFAELVRVPDSVICPAVIFLCMVGAYLEGSGLITVYVMIFFAVVGYLFRKLDLSLITFLIGFVVTPMFEVALRQSLVLSDGEVSVLLEHPMAIVFLLLSVVTVVFIVLRRHRSAPLLIED